MNYIQYIFDGLILGNTPFDYNSISIEDINLANLVKQILIENDYNDELYTLIVNRWFNQNNKVLPKDFKINSTILYLWMALAGTNFLNCKPSKQIIELKVDLNNGDSIRLCNLLKKYFNSSKIYANQNNIVIDRENHNKFIKKCKENNLKLPNKEYKFII